MTTRAETQRRRFVVRGVVQGVGFRPFVYRLASASGLAGFVRNDAGGVIVEAEGRPPALDRFSLRLRSDAPAQARVDSVTVADIPLTGDDAFAVTGSGSGAGTALVPPDLATCDECLAELFDPGDRRHRYPFINCTDCGPRLSIVERTPYDRRNTTMAGFAMCGPCLAEYEDPSNRRFHAEPIACPDCGPALSMPLEEALAALREGAIVAVKGLGGWHLACDASSEVAVSRLRRRKHRDEKPFALMAAEPARIAELADHEHELLRSARAPIVLVRRRPGAPVAASVAPSGPWLGVMAPYTPLHHLLCADFGGALVMTSGNRADEPIATQDAEARERLGHIADAFLGNDRPIARRCEDSVLRSRLPVRRSRGYSPERLTLPRPARRTIVAAGAELKATFCVARGGDAYLSPHLGDLRGEAAYRSFRRDLDLYLEMLGIEATAAACDLHPDYLSTRWAEANFGEPVRVQHHHAHAAACLAEHRRSGPALALVFDGTGYGTDGTIWGGELLRFGLERFERLAHLEPIPLPGGERAVREPWRVAAAYLERAGRPVPYERWPEVRQSLAVNAPLSSGMGRLFDAVAALLGVRSRIGYEGQAAIELEHLAGSAAARPYGCRQSDDVIHGADLVAAAHDDLAAGRDRAEIAAAFHEGVAAAAAAAAARAGEPGTIVLSGGSFQNVRLLASLRRRLEESGFEVLAHRLVPPNDGGISYGQAAIAAARL